MPLTDLYELVDVQTIQGQEILNVYYFTNVNVDHDAADLADWFVEQYLPDIAAAQGADLVHTGVRVRNLYDAGDIADVSINEPGTFLSAGSDILPRHDAVSITLYGPGSTTRPGGKRIAGINESAAEDGVLVEGILTVLNTLMDTLVGYILDDASTAAFRHVIVKRIASVVDGVTQYRLPENLAETITQAVVDAGYSLLVSTQTSRKR